MIDIRERTKRKRGEKASKKQRRANRHASSWAFAELHGYIAYKAMLAGSMAVKVDAHYTSQACPMCGYTSKENRPNRGLLFVCQSCRCCLHADLIGARNIALRMLLIRQDWMSTGTLSVCPDVSDDEAKAARRQRYAELRWLTPCPLPRQDGIVYSEMAPSFHRVEYFSRLYYQLPIGTWPYASVTSGRDSHFLRLFSEKGRV